jgi:hypothetical protein
MRWDIRLRGWTGSIGTKCAVEMQPTHVERLVSVEAHMACAPGEPRAIASCLPQVTVSCRGDARQNTRGRPASAAAPRLPGRASRIRSDEAGTVRRPRWRRRCVGARCLRTTLVDRPAPDAGAEAFWRVTRSTRGRVATDVEPHRSGRAVDRRDGDGGRGLGYMHRARGGADRTPTGGATSLTERGYTSTTWQRVTLVLSPNSRGGES